MNKITNCLAAFAVVVAISGCMSKEDKVASLLESGTDFLEQGDAGRARVQFRNVLQVEPNNIEAYRGLYKVALKNKSSKGQYKYLSKLEQLLPEDMEIKIKLSKLMITVGQMDDAAKKAEQVLAVNEQSSDAWLIMATISLQKGFTDSTIVNANNSLKLDPKNIEALLLLAGAYRLKEDFEKAVSYVDKAIKISPSYEAPRLIRIEFYRDLERFDLMEGDLNYLVSNYPSNLDYALSLVRLLRDSDRLGEAEQVLTEFSKANTPNEKVYRVLLDLIDAQGDVNRADLMLAEIIKSTPKENANTLKFVLVERLLNKGSKQEAVELLTQLMSDSEKEIAHRAKARRAEIYIKDNEAELGMQLIKDVLAVDAQNEPALLVRSFLSMSQKNFDQSIQDLRVVLRNNPESEVALMLLGRAYMQSGSDDLADSNFRGALRLNPGNLGAAMPVINRMIASGDLSRSEQVIKNALRLKPTDPSLLSLLAQVRLMRRDFVGSQSVIDSMGDNEESRAFRHFLSGKIFQSQEKHDLAIVRYEEALAVDSTFVRAMEGYAQSMIAMGRHDELVQWLDSRINSNKNFIGNYSLKAAVLRSQERYDESIATLNEALELNNTWEQGYIQIAAIHELQGDKGAALSSFSEGLRAQASLRLYVLKASLQERMGRKRAALEDYENAYEMSPDNLAVRNNLANLLADDPKSAGRVLELTKDFGEHDIPQLLDTRGWVLYKSGKLQEASPLLRRAVSDLSNLPEVNYHYGRLLIDLGKKEEAKPYLEKAASLPIADSDLKVAIEEALLSIQGG